MIDLTDEQVKADVMNRLLRRRCWGAKYLPIDSLVNWMGRQILNNGSRVRRMIDELEGDGYLILHKRKTTASLNPRMLREIRGYIEGHLV